MARTYVCSRCGRRFRSKQRAGRHIEKCRGIPPGDASMIRKENPDYVDRITFGSWMLYASEMDDRED